MQIETVMSGMPATKPLDREGVETMRRYMRLIEVNGMVTYTVPALNTLLQRASALLDSYEAMKRDVERLRQDKKRLVDDYNRLRCEHTALQDACASRAGCANVATDAAGAAPAPAHTSVGEACALAIDAVARNIGHNLANVEAYARTAEILSRVRLNMEQ